MPPPGAVVAHVSEVNVCVFLFDHFLLQPPVVVAGGAPVPLMAGVATNVFYPQVASLDFSIRVFSPS